MGGLFPCQRCCISCHSPAHIPMVTGWEGLAVVASPWFRAAPIPTGMVLAQRSAGLSLGRSLPGRDPPGLQRAVGSRGQPAALGQGLGKAVGPRSLSAQRLWKQACLTQRRPM